MKTETETESRSTLDETGRVAVHTSGFGSGIPIRLHRLYESCTSERSHVLRDWFKAASELLRLTPVEVRESGSDLIVRAELPGFGPDDLAVSIGARRVLITARKDQDRTVGSWIDLPAEVMPEKATGTLAAGTLTVTLRRAA